MFSVRYNNKSISFGQANKTNFSCFNDWCQIRQIIPSRLTDIFLFLMVTFLNKLNTTKLYRSSTTHSYMQHTRIVNQIINIITFLTRQLTQRSIASLLDI